MNGYQIPGPHPLEQLDHVVLAAVARDVDLLETRVHDLASETEQVADQARHRALVSGDDPGREDGGVSGPGSEAFVLAHADEGQGETRPGYLCHPSFHVHGTRVAYAGHW